MKKRMLRYVVLAMMVAAAHGWRIYYVGRILATKSDITSEIGRR